MLFSSFDRQITIERATETLDQNGRLVKTWATVGTLYARVRYGGGAEKEQRGQIQSQVNCVFTTRYYSVSTADRIVFDGKHYNIVSISELGRRAGLEIVANQFAGR